MQFIKAEWVFSHPEHSKWVKDLSFSFSQHIVESGIFLPGFSDRQWREQGCVELPPHVHILGAQSQGSSESPALDVTVTHCWPSTHGRISLQQAKPSLASPVWAPGSVHLLCRCSFSWFTCKLLCNLQWCWDTMCHFLCLWEATDSSFLDCDRISTGIWLSHFFPFFYFNVFSMSS